MTPDRIHLSWNAWQNQKEFVRIADALEKHFAEYRFCVRIALRKHQSRDQAELSFYVEEKMEDRKICTIRHFLGSYLSIHNIIAAVGTALGKQV